MKISKAMQKFADRAKERDSYWFERAKLNFAVDLEKQRRAAGLNYAALAEKIGASPAYISKVFHGDTNLTIESMVKLTRATGGQLTIGVSSERLDAKKWGWAVKVTPASAANQPWRTESGVTPSSATGLGQVMYG